MSSTNPKKRPAASSPPSSASDEDEGAHRRKEALLRMRLAEGRSKDLLQRDLESFHEGAELVGSAAKRRALGGEAAGAAAGSPARAVSGKGDQKERCNLSCKRNTTA
jgi:hypothetical protein